MKNVRLASAQSPGVGPVFPSIGTTSGMKMTRPWQRLCDLNGATLGYVLLLPAFLLLALIVVYPIGRLFYNSFFDLRLSSSVDAAQFVGLQNYADVFHDGEFWMALRNTVLVVVITVPGALVVGLGLALLANQMRRAQALLRLSLLLPWALPLSFTGLIFAWFFHSEYGVVNDVLQRLGGIEPRMWLTQAWSASFAIWLTIIWKTSSFMALILLAGLQMIPRSLYEAAEVDGASAWQQFRHITLPMLTPSILVALIFRTITALQTFDIPYTMTHGGPGQATETLAMLIHKTTIDYLDVGYGSTLAVMMFVLSLLLSMVYIRFVGRGGSQ
jgi:ABC-type sugar transport system permease subunit